MRAKLSVRQIVESLRDHPEQWDFSDYEATHSSGVSVWIANGHYGLDVKFKGTVIYGGVTALSAFFGWAMPTRRRLRSAVRRASQEQAAIALARVVQ